LRLGGDLVRDRLRAGACDPAQRLPERDVVASIVRKRLRKSGSASSAFSDARNASVGSPASCWCVAASES